MNTIDNDGNKLHLANDGIYLQLKSDSMRYLEIFSFRNGMIQKYVKKTNIMNTVHGTPSVGFNYNALKLIRNRTKHSKIYIKFSKGVKENTKEVYIDEILEDGSFLKFLKQGFELQIFFPINKMKDYKWKKRT